MTYDAKHQMLTSTDAAGQTTTYSYTASTQIETVTTPPRAGITEQRTTTYGYDATTGDLLSVTGPGGVTTTRTYDDYGRLRTTTDSDNYTLNYDYDILDRLTKTTYPDGTYEETQYARLDPGRRRDRMGRWSQTFYDKVRRVAATIDPAGRVVTQQWCKCGSLDRLIDPNKNATTWERDVQGRVTKEIRANGSVKSFLYETTISRLKKVTDAKLQETQYTYALDDKLTAISYANAEHPTPSVSFSYTDPQTSAPDAHGRLRQMLDGTGTTIYAYHPITGGASLGAGQLASVDGPLADDTVSYGYDELGRVANRSLNGATSTWSYDPQGRLAAQVDPIGSFSYAYVGNTGRTSAVTYPNGQTTSYAYYPVNQDLRLQEIHHKKPDTTTLSRFSYTYDAVGNIKLWTHQTDLNPANAYDFGYDRADQLTSATYRTTAATPQILKRYAYAYDPAGNRTSEQIDDAVTGASYDNMNRLTSQQPGGALLISGSVSEAATLTVQGKPAQVAPDGSFSAQVQATPGTNTVTVVATDASGNVKTNTYQVSVSGATTGYSYDANGNLTGDGTRSFEWDAENRLMAVKQGATTVASFVYGGEGRRAQKIAGGVTTTYVYDESNFLEERPNVGSTTRYVHGLGIDRPLAHVVGGIVSYYVADHLGSIVRMTDGAGAPVLTRQYDPWGNLAAGAASGGHAYTGREWDAETGLAYYRARYYDPKIGRFISEDPIRAGLHLYGYARSNPARFVDPLGLKAGDAYGSVDEAALAALKEWNPMSIEINREYGGSIYCDAGKQKYTVPNVNLDFSDYVPFSKPPAGKKLTGRYHTHGRNGNDGLSGPDQQLADGEQVPWYVGTPIGTIVKYDPAVGLPQVIIGRTRVPK